MKRSNEPGYVRLVKPIGYGGTRHGIKHGFLLPSLWYEKTQKRRPVERVAEFPDEAFSWFSICFTKPNLFLLCPRSRLSPSTGDVLGSPNGGNLTTILDLGSRLKSCDKHHLALRRSYSAAGPFQGVLLGPEWRRFENSRWEPALTPGCVGSRARLFSGWPPYPRQRSKTAAPSCRWADRCKPPAGAWHASPRCMCKDASIDGHEV